MPGTSDEPAPGSSEWYEEGDAFSKTQAQPPPPHGMQPPSSLRKRPQPPKGHTYRIDLHEAFERAMGDSPTTMGPVLQLLNNQVEILQHPRKNDRCCVGDEVCATCNETHKGEEKRYLYWGRVMKINSDSVEVKWDCEKEAHCYPHDHVHATLGAVFAMVHGVEVANQAPSSSCSNGVVSTPAKQPRKPAPTAPAKRPRGEALLAHGPKRQRHWSLCTLEEE